MQNENFRACSTCVHGKRMKNGTHTTCLKWLMLRLDIDTCEHFHHINDKYLNHLKPYQRDAFVKMLKDHEPNMNPHEITEFLKGYHKILLPNENIF